MSFDAFITAYPWDLVDEGVDPALDLLHGELGVTGVAVWMATPPVTQLRVRAVEPRIFRTRGGLFFQPSEAKYEATRCKPVISTWLRGRNPLDAIAEGCARRGLSLRVRVSASDTGRLAAKHPEIACKNLFGATSTSSICLANPDAQAYLRALASDLSAQHELAGLSLADVHLGDRDALAADLLPQAPLGMVERCLLSICFCESCLQKAEAAGADANKARQRATNMLTASLERGQPVDVKWNTLLADNEPLTAYLQWQSDEMATLLGSVLDAASTEVLLERNTTTDLRPVAPCMATNIPHAVVTGIRDAQQMSAARCPDARRNELHIPAYLVIAKGGEALTAALGTASECGFSGAMIDNFGLLPVSALSSIKRAIRFARRAGDR